jgi:glycosyltransferase involved in cell wall biosynthesis
MTDLAVIILCKDEELHLARALKHVAAISKQIFVIDSYSTDGTMEIARKFGATVLQNKFINYAKQFQWAIDNAPITAEWVMRLDADEVVERDLADNLLSRLAALPADVVGINLKRKHIFMGRWIRHGGRYPLVLLRIWRRGHGRIENRWMDEHMIVSGGRTVVFDGGFADHNLKDLTFFTEKHNWYATREAIDILVQRFSLGGVENLRREHSSRQASIKRFVKQKVYNKMQLQFAPLAYFVYRYFFQLGFLDGKEGLIYHVLQGFWYRFLVGAKVVEFEAAIAHLGTRDARRLELSRITGHQI